MWIATSIGLGLELMMSATGAAKTASTRLAAKRTAADEHRLNSFLPALFLNTTRRLLRQRECAHIPSQFISTTLEIVTTLFAVEFDPTLKYPDAD
jgi:hypothetical protein